jgi:hypothetical protein
MGSLNPYGPSPLGPEMMRQRHIFALIKQDHRPGPTQGGNIICACSAPVAILEFDNHLRDELKRVLELKGVSNG